MVPLQNVYPKNGEQEKGASKDDYIIRLSSHLHTLTKSILPSWDKIFSQAEDVLKTLQERDQEFYDHITSVIKDGMQPVDVHAFAYEILVKGQKKSVKVWNDLEKKRRRNWKPTELEIFGDVAIYLRKWISECFVGIFSTPTILFVWDYLFMNNWKCMRKLCIVTLALLRPWAMRAQSQRELIRVLNEEPNKVYLQDIRHALLAYDRDNIDTMKIAACNTNIEISAPEEKKEVSENKEDEKENNEDSNDTNEATNVEEKKDEETADENETSAKPTNDENQSNAEEPKSKSDESKDAPEQPANSEKESEKKEDKKKNELKYCISSHY